MGALEELLSRDPARIWSAACEVRTWFDRPRLLELASHLEEITAATRGVDLGGGLIGKFYHLERALARLAFVKEGGGCLCALYPDDMFFEPPGEQRAGRVKILETVKPDGIWVDHYVCECLQCGSLFKVIERDYHYTWWGWEKLKQP